MDAALLIARLLLAAVFALAGAAKLADLTGSRSAVAGFGVPARSAAAIGTLLPFAEIAIAVALLPAGTARAAALAALVMLAVFCIAIGASMARGRAPDCHCFGQLRSEPVGRGTLLRNLAMAAVAGFVAFAGGAGPGVGEAIAGLDPMLAAVLLGAVALTPVVVGAALVVLWLLRQNGRLLVRVEALESALDRAGVSRSVPGAGVSEGLTVGLPAPRFERPSLAGPTVALDSLLSNGVPVLVVFTSPRCGSCRELTPQIAGWHRESARGLAVALVSEGDSEEVLGDEALAEIADRVLLDPSGEIADTFDAEVTPSAVVVLPDGRIASSVAAGPIAITALAESFAGAGSEPLEVVRVDSAEAAGAGLPA